MKRRRPLAFIVFLALASTASAQGAALSIPLPAGGDMRRESARYDCANLGRLGVDYVTAGAVALALLEINGQPRVFAQVLSGSGARYASGPYVWWTKGADAMLEDLRQGSGTPPLACSGVR
ncbi:MAG: MliC family protein [Pseudomonadota bacterium]